MQKELIYYRRGGYPDLRKARYIAYQTHTTCGETDRQTHRQISNSKTLFYKDCSLGLVKNLSNK